ncbi:MAG: hypothetical protein KC457_23700, partial [Myxococcales bacterium]|nr:hypothetical protein [Myxococcales bacterium]
MAKYFTLYMDDSGTRHPDQDLDPVARRDWFGLGGILVHKDDMDQCHAMYETLRTRWPEMGTSPLHSEEIRMKKKGFRWLRADEESRRVFLGDLEAMLVQMPIIGIAC